MKKEYRDRLQANRSYLEENLEVDEILDLCFQKQVFTHCDMERIRAERSRPDKALKFIDILKRKPSDKCYEDFLMVLDDNKGQNFISKYLRETTLFEQPDSDQERALEQILKEKFLIKASTECSVEQFLRIIRVQLRHMKKSLEGSETEVFKLAKAVFPEVKLKQNKRRNVVALQNLGVKPLILQSVCNQDDDSNENTPMTVTIPLEKISPKDVAAVLRAELQKEVLEVTLADRIEEQEIDGKSLSQMKDDHIEKLFPDLKMGKRIKLLEAIQQTLKELQTRSEMPSENAPTKGSRKLETFRAFDKRPGPKDVYEKGYVLPEEQSRPGSLLHVIHKYCMIRHCDWKTFAQETVKFAAACMNERANGTIHFGVVSKYESRPGLHAGEIVGLQLDTLGPETLQCESVLTEEIYQAFYHDQREIALKCIRDPVYIPVGDKDVNVSHLYVVEVDVVPHCDIVMNEAFFLNSATGRRSLLLRYVDGVPTEVSGEDLIQFMDFRKNLTALRQEEEKSVHYVPAEKPDLHRKLHGLLTDEKDYGMVDIFPLLFLSPCASNMDREFLTEHFKCIKSLEPMAVFDFDSAMQNSNGCHRGLHSIVESELGEVYQVFTTDNFDKNSEENMSSDNKDNVSKLLESISMSSFKSWIFCNGYQPLNKKELEAAAWRSSRGSGFKESVRFYCEQIPASKARILIFLLSRNYEVLLGALEEIFVKFPDQWIIVAESEKVANQLTSEVLRRKYVEKQVLEERCVVGMPWSHVNHSIMNIFGFRAGTGCTLPTSTGTPCMMKEREKNTLSDLEILSMSQCRDEDIVLKGSTKDLDKFKRKTEEDFYRGQQVSWWNFWFRDHVLKRSQFDELHSMVDETLNGIKIPEDEKVAVRTLLHQPGAGGTTLARQLLWEMKNQVRCCAVKQITDQTCDQIARLRSFEEPDCPKPTLVLIDNEDEEKVFQLCSHLNEKARREARDTKDAQKIFCVLIICIRMTSLPKRKDKSKVMLGHELQQEEVLWFNTKYETLEERYKQKQGLHPKLLISFNILKENFNQDYIKHTVDEFVNEIRDYREQRLLKYIALINSFELDFQAIPMSCFNVIMCPPISKKNDKATLGRGTFSKGDTLWEASLSQSLNILLNRTSIPCLGSLTKAVRIIHNKLSREILHNLCERERKVTSDVILEFLHSSIFKKSNESSMQNQLIKTVKDMLKKRAAYKKGREKFSPIIKAIGEEEGYEKAAEVLIVGFDLLDDPMIAQQISRVYIHIQNWKEADKYARMAQDIKPNNSYLCDTHGQVYKEQLIKIWRECLESEEQLEDEKAKDVIDVAFKAINIFRREQKLSDDNCSTGYNNCGFFSELRVVVTLLDLCRFLKVFKCDKGSMLHKFLVNKSYVPDDLMESLGKERIEQLKRLSAEYEKPMRRLEDEQIQLKEDSCYQYSPSYSNSVNDRRMFVHLQECLDTYFGEDSDEVPSELRPEDACDFRRRRVKRRGGNSLRSIYGLREDNNAAQEFHSMYVLIEKNVQSPFCNAFDLRTILNLILARVSLDKNHARIIPMDRILEWTQLLYETTKSDPVPYLEAYLYLVMFHWPTEWRIGKGLQLCPCNKIRDVIKEWKATFQNNHPAQKEAEGRKPDRRKGTTLFFLGQGEGFDEIVFYSELHGFDNRRQRVGDSIWDTELARRRLRRLKGTLLQGGGEMAVTIYSSKGSATQLEIPTSFPIKDHSLWQKNVQFVLGFCWSGPKAYSVTRDDVVDLKGVSTPLNFTVTRRNYDRYQQKMMSVEAVEEFWQRYFKNQADLEIVEKDIRFCNNTIKAQKLNRKKEELEKEREYLVQKRTSVLTGPD